MYPIHLHVTSLPFLVNKDWDHVIQLAMSIMMANTFPGYGNLFSTWGYCHNQLHFISVVLHMQLSYFNDDSEDSSVCGEWSLASTNIMWRCLYIYRWWKSCRRSVAIARTACILYLYVLELIILFRFIYCDRGNHLVYHWSACWVNCWCSSCVWVF